jgi:hypothetical protein
VTPYWSAIAIGASAAVDGDAGAAGVADAEPATAAVPKITSSRIKGFTPHGLDQVLGRDGGVGVCDSALNDAVDHPLSVVKKVDSQGRIGYRYMGQNATVVLNPDGMVVTAWARNSSGLRYS